MAIIRFGMTVTGLRGTVGGVTYSAAGAGPYAKQWRAPRKVQTFAAVGARQAFALTAPGWRGLTDTQRSDWRTWAADPAQERTNSLGEPYYLAGWQQYALITTQLGTCGRAARVDPPTTSTPATPVTASIVAEVSAGVPFLELTLDGSEFPAGGDIVVFLWIGPIGARTVVPARGLIGYADEVSSGDVLDLTDAAVAIFGMLYPGQQVFCGTAAQDDEGQRSAVYWVNATFVEV
jgi:hypothetical protein